MDMTGEGRGARAERFGLLGFARKRSMLQSVVPSSGVEVNPGAGRRRRRLPFVAAATSAVLIAGALIGIFSTEASAASCSPNPVVCENAKAGSPPSEWDIDGAGDGTVQGFATDMSVNAGSTVNFKVQAEAAYTISIYRLGYYGGNGARKIATLPGTFPAQNQDKACVSNSTTLIYDCGTWAVSASWAVPSTAVSGVYFALLTRPDTGGDSHISFVVRDDSSTSGVIFKTSDATWQAYNLYGGADFYNEGPNGRATKLSYNRPFATRGVNDGRDFLFSNEYPAIRFMERNGYDVTYTTDVDTDRNGALLKNHKVFMAVGHDEYWSGPQRAAVEAARDAGTSLTFLSGNEVYWKTRWEPSQDGANTDHRTVVCYKETWDNAKSDPSPEWTGTWRDPRYSPPANGGRPENALTGVAYMANHDDLPIQIPAAQGKTRFWRNTSVASLTAGATATLAAHTVGYESDEDLDNGVRPAGLIRVSTTTGATPEYLRDFGNVVTPGTTTHSMTLYRVPSGALVFGAGTIQYAWALDANHDSSFAAVAADVRLQQATINLLADMKVQPATLMTGMVAASASADTTGPVTTINTPTGTLTNGALTTISGTAVDSGGIVAGVEVSLDNGSTWHPATGTSTWSYTGAVTGSGTATIKVRATDDSANIGAAVSRTVSLTGSTSLFGSRVPATPAATDTGATELGLKITSQTDGFVKGVRFYKGTGNTGTHTGSLWTSTGSQLATGTFTNETATGWQTLLFSTPVAVTAGTTYVVSYTAPSGHYAADPWAFSYGAYVSAPLSAQRSLNADGNGLFGNAGQFPTQSFQASNYYVDVAFDSSALTPPEVTSTFPLPNATYVPTTAKPSVTFTKAINPATVVFTETTGLKVAGSISYDAASKTATFNPSAPLPAGQKFNVSVIASDTNGNAMVAAKIWSFTTNPGTGTVSTLFADTDTPATPAITETTAVSLGVKFTPSTSGSVLGVRFYKGTGNTGTHTGSLWSATGTQLATATFVSETTSGWQYVYFAQPVAVTAGTTYVVSYYAPRGDYAVTSNYFASARTSGPLTAPAGANGTYVYGSDAFPTNSFSSTNYWVDPMFAGSTTSPSPTPTVTTTPTTGPTTPAPTTAPTTTAPTTAPTTPPAATVKSLFAATAVPSIAAWPDATATEVGMKFTADVAGSITGVRFYKGAGNSGTHTGSLWTASGALLATGTFVNETASGWQSLVFASPVSISANTPYVVSYQAPVGRYALDLSAMALPVVNAPLRSVPSGGYYRAGAGFPSTTIIHNFWVDVTFKPAS